MLYPGIDVNGDYHVDHIYLRKRFKRATLRAAGLADVEVDAYGSKVDRLPNVQLLEGPENPSKQAALPHDWIERAISDPSTGRSSSTGTICTTSG